MLKVNSESALKFEKAKREMEFGRLSRNNIIDLIDMIVRRTYIKPALSAIIKNFFLENVCCKCKRSCLRDKKDREQQRILTRGFGLLRKNFDVSKLMEAGSMTQLMMSALLTK